MEQLSKGVWERITDTFHREKFKKYLQDKELQKAEGDLYLEKDYYDAAVGREN